MSGLPQRPAGTWKSTLAPGLGNAALRVVTDVAERLRSHDLVEAAAALTARQTGFPEIARWIPFSLADGDAGLAVLSGYLDRCFPDDGWETTGHHQLSLGARAVERSGCPQPGLFGGLSGLAYAALSLSRNGARYQRLRTRLDAVVMMQCHKLIGESAPHGCGMAVGTFDLISGLTGVGAYLVARGEQSGDFRAAEDVLRALMAITARRDTLPSWHTPAHLVVDPAQLRHQPFGSLNCGLAHGIPGPLALMSVSVSAGIAMPELRERIAQLAEWLIGQRLAGEWGITWPSVIPLTSDGRLSVPTPTRTAWCYGAPGVARALWLAGTALGDQRLCDTAIEAMSVVHRTPPEHQAVDSPTLCHGLGGLLQITLRFAHDTGRSEFTTAAEVLVDRILRTYEPDSVVALRDVEPDGRKVDRAGLLTGAAGVAAALLSAASDVEPTWDRALLLA